MLVLHYLVIFCVMTTSSQLFKKITICSNAIRHLKEDDGGHNASYDEVLEFLPRGKVFKGDNTKMVKASLEYIKSGLRDHSDEKAKFSFYVASLMAEGKDKDGLAKEVCNRFRIIDDFDRNALDKIFNLCLCNDRVRRLLDNALISKTESIHPSFKRFFDVEFVEIFFNVMEIVVCRKQSLADLGYMAKVTDDNIKGARELMHKHLDDIATKCSPCFNPDVLKLSRDQNKLFPKGGGLPCVLIGRKHLEGEEATISKLQESLIDKDEKGEFLEMMFAIISHASNKDNPVVTYRILTLQSVKDFFLEKVLDKSQEEETRQAILGSDEARELRQKVKSLKEENSSLKEKVSSLQEMDLDLRKVISEAMDSNKSLRNKCEQLELECANVRSLKLDLALTKRNENYLREDRCNLVKKGKLTHKEEEDMIWQGIHGGQIKKQKDNVWSGDELDE